MAKAIKKDPVIMQADSLFIVQLKLVPVALNYCVDGILEIFHLLSSKNPVSEHEE